MDVGGLFKFVGMKVPGTKVCEDEMLGADGLCKCTSHASSGMTMLEGNGLLAVGTSGLMHKDISIHGQLGDAARIKSVPEDDNLAASPLRKDIIGAVDHGPIRERYGLIAANVLEDPSRLQAMVLLQLLRQDGAPLLLLLDDVAEAED